MKRLILDAALFINGSYLGIQSVAFATDLITKSILGVLSVISFSIIIIVNVEKNKEHLKTFFNRFKKKK